MSPTGIRTRLLFLEDSDNGGLFGKNTVLIAKVLGDGPYARVLPLSRLTLWDIVEELCKAE